MTVTTVFRGALTRTGDDPAAGTADLLARACVAALPFDGAGLSMSLMPGHRLPLGVSDLTAAQAERLQYTLGEGPCLTAQRSRTAVDVAQEHLMERWPAYATELFTRTPYRSILSLPVGGPLAGCVVLDLFRSRSGHLAPGLLDDVCEIAGLVGDELAHDLASDPGQDGAGLGLPPVLSNPLIQARQRVWIAAGCLAGEHGITMTAAVSLLRATAFGLSLDLETTADRVISGELRP